MPATQRHASPLLLLPCMVCLAWLAWRGLVTFLGAWAPLQAPAHVFIRRSDHGQPAGIRGAFVLDRHHT
mgnify:CR=1 FL=1